MTYAQYKVAWLRQGICGAFVEKKMGRISAPQSLCLRSGDEILAVGFFVGFLDAILGLAALGFWCADFLD
jgi:hypothetical protein